MCIHVYFTTDCGSLTPPTNGSMSEQNSTTYLSTVEFECDMGFDLIGNHSLVCNGTGHWNATVPACRIKGEY